MRFRLALFLSKLAAKTIRIIAKDKGTFFPGRLALKIDPNFVAHIKGVDPNKAVFITGTNGKSTTTNLIHHILTDAGKTVCANLSGANMLTGVATNMLKDCTWGGRLRSEMVVMETDERYLHLIREQLPAKYLVVVNIQKDQAQRNGEPSFIRDKVASAIGKDVTVFVNHDEPKSYALKELAGAFKSYAVAPNSESFEKEDDFFSVSAPCPKCHNPIKYIKYNIENVGPFVCPTCGFGDDGRPDFVAEDVDFEAKKFKVDGAEYDLNFNTPYFVYCYIAAYGVAKTFGLSTEEIQKAFNHFKDINGRLEDRDVKGKKLHYVKMKQENSETLQSSINYIADQKTDKAFMVAYDEYLDFFPPLNISFYLFDCDLRGLRKSGVKKCVCMSQALGKAMALRFYYDGYTDEQVEMLDNDFEDTVVPAIAALPAEEVYLVDEMPYFHRDGDKPYA